MLKTITLCSVHDSYYYYYTPRNNIMFNNEQKIPYVPSTRITMFILHRMQE